MTRLTIDIREQIVENAIVKSGLPKRQAALNSKRAKWAERARVKALGGKAKLEKIVKIIDEIDRLTKLLPESVLDKRLYARIDNYIIAEIGGQRHVVFFNGAKQVSHGFKRYSDKEEVLKMTTNGNPKFSTDSKEAKLYFGYIDEQTDIDGAKETLKAQVRAAVNSVNTVKQLLDVWPEAKELIPEQVLKPNPKKGLPSVPVADLNKAVGLPSKAKAA
jgi:hypothetical protein